MAMKKVKRFQVLTNNENKIHRLAFFKARRETCVYKIHSATSVRRAEDNFVSK